MEVNDFFYFVGKISDIEIPEKVKITSEIGYVTVKTENKEALLKLLGIMLEKMDLKIVTTKEFENKRLCITVKKIRGKSRNI